MSGPCIVVLDGHAVNPGDLSWAEIQALGDLRVYDRTARDRVVERASGADVLVTNKTPIDAQVLESVPELAGISVLATGVNVVDVELATARGIPVCNVPNYGTASVVEHTFALLFELCRNVGEHDRAVHSGEWAGSPDFSFWKTPQLELSGRRLGIVGYGAIGRAVGRVARALGMHVVATPSRGQAPEEGVLTDDLDGIFRTADVITLHCPLTPATAGLVRWERLVSMKPTSLLVNTARGGLIREADLAQALRDGLLAGAALDVLSEEPPRAENPLLCAPRCVITPHLAWSTRDARKRLLSMTADNIRAILAGRPIHVVNS